MGECFMLDDLQSIESEDILGEHHQHLTMC